MSRLKLTTKMILTLLVITLVIMILRTILTDQSAQQAEHKSALKEYQQIDQMVKGAYDTFTSNDLGWQHALQVMSEDMMNEAGVSYIALYNTNGLMVVRSDKKQRPNKIINHQTKIVQKLLRRKQVSYSRHITKDRTFHFFAPIINNTSKAPIGVIELMMDLTDQALFFNAPGQPYLAPDIMMAETYARSILRDLDILYIALQDVLDDKQHQLQTFISQFNNNESVNQILIYNQQNNRIAELHDRDDIKTIDQTINTQQDQHSLPNKIMINGREFHASAVFNASDKKQSGLILISMAEPGNITNQNLLLQRHTLEIIILGLLFIALLLIFIRRITRESKNTDHTDAINHEIQNYKETIKTLVNNQKMAEVSHAAKAKGLWHINHELHATLNTILNFAQHNPKLINDTSNDISKASKSLNETISELLDLTWSEAGKIDAIMADIDLQSILVSCINTTKPSADEKSITLSSNIDDENHILWADRMWLEQVFIHLISNAIKYNHKGGQVELKFETTEPGWLHISIIDSGTGFLNKNSSEVFDPFKQNQHASGAQPHRQIDLAICKHLVHLMGGKIGVKSSNSNGTIFWLSLFLGRPNKDVTQNDNNAQTMALDTNPSP